MSDATPQEAPAESVVGEPVSVTPDETKAPEESVEVAPEAPEADQVDDDTPGVDDSDPSEEGDV